jgi:hypothetical protein
MCPVCAHVHISGGAGAPLVRPARAQAVCVHVVRPALRRAAPPHVPLRARARQGDGGGRLGVLHAGGGD